jgi:anti-sigma factor RsiW
MFGHVFNSLAAYAEQQLDAPERSRVERHLAGCDVCRAALDDIRTGILLASTLNAEPMPADVATRIRSALASTADRPLAGRESSWAVRRLAAAAAILVLAIGLFWHLNRPWIRLEAAAAPATTFEEDGRQLHDRIAEGTATLALESADEQSLWRWLAGQGAPVTTMTIARPDADRSRVVPRGAAVYTLGGVQSSVLSYRIDNRAVTLALARSADVPDAPGAGWWSKRVSHRRDGSGVNTLTWTVGGGTYVMVSELDGAGQRACTICHTTPRFTDALTRLSNPGILDRH